MGGDALKDSMDTESARKKLGAHHQEQVPLGAFTNEKMKVGDSQITRSRQPEERVQMLQYGPVNTFEQELLHLQNRPSTLMKIPIDDVDLEIYTFLCDVKNSWSFT